MKQNITLGASVLAALTASICCAGPLVTLALGLGSFGMAGLLETARPYLLVGTFVLLGAAFYFTYRKREVVCDDGTCLVSGVSRWNKVLLWMSTVFIILFTTFPYYSETLMAALDGDFHPSTAVRFPVTNVASFDQLQQQFNRDSASVRLITLLSPT